MKLWLIERLEEGQWLAHAETDESTDAILNRLGRVPLPPYIRGGNMVDADVASYQTVYAERPGAIAAPTAGLHFTKELIKALERVASRIRGSRCMLDWGRFDPLKVRLGTSIACTAKPVKSRRDRGEEINRTRVEGGRVIAVGTTVMRLLETAVRANGGRQTSREYEAMER